MKKEDFYNLSKDESMNYINEHYYIEDVIDVCEDFIFDNCDTTDDAEYILEEYQPIEYVLDSLEDDDLKDFLWYRVIEQCEECEED